MTTRLLTALTAAALTTLPAASAHAQGAMPTPGCHGVHVTDKAGDSANSLVTGEQAPPQSGGPSTDLIAGWIDYDGAKATANIQVDELEASPIDPGFNGIAWTYTFSTPDGTRYVRAFKDLSGTAKFTWGEPRLVTDDQTAPRAGGETKGQFFPGKGGVIQVEIPLAEVGAKPGSVLKGHTLETRQFAGGAPAAMPSTGLPIYSVAPVFDDAAGKQTFTVGPCPAAKAPGAPGGPPAPAPVEPSPAAPGAPAAPAAGSGDFGVKVTVPKLSAKKLKTAKKFTVKLSGTASGITAVVRKQLNSGKNLAAGKLATLKGSGKLTLTKAKLKKGTYFLIFSGKNAQGQTAEGAVKITVK
jgi:hypothetical protein